MRLNAKLRRLALKPSARLRKHDLRLKEQRWRRLQLLKKRRKWTLILPRTMMLMISSQQLKMSTGMMSSSMSSQASMAISVV